MVYVRLGSYVIRFVSVVVSFVHSNPKTLNQRAQFVHNTYLWSDFSERVNLAIMLLSSRDVPPRIERIDYVRRYGSRAQDSIFGRGLYPSVV